MFDEQEQFLLHQIRILLKQLDERQTKQKDEEKPENKDDRYRTLLQLSCKIDTDGKYNLSGRTRNHQFLSHAYAGS